MAWCTEPWLLSDTIEKWNRRLECGTILSSCDLWTDFNFHLLQYCRISLHSKKIQELAHYYFLCLFSLSTCHANAIVCLSLKFLCRLTWYWDSLEWKQSWKCKRDSRDYKKWYRRSSPGMCLVFGGRLCKVCTRLFPTGFNGRTCNSHKI